MFDIDLWEYNQAYASQAIIAATSSAFQGSPQCQWLRDFDRPFLRREMVSHIALEGRSRNANFGVVSVGVADSIGCYALL